MVNFKQALSNMKIFNSIFAILFLVSAALQYNDSDPYLWIPLYLYGAWLCFMAAKGLYFPKAYVAGIAVYLLYALYLLFVEHGVTEWYGGHRTGELVQSMQADKPWIEETREFGGLLILALVLSVNLLAARRKRGIKPS